MDAKIGNRDLDDHLNEAPESRDRAYLKWRDAKVRAALEEAKAKPDSLIPHQQVHAMLGL